MAVIHRAIPLNNNGSYLKIVSRTTEPEYPKENTIWINTSTKIGEWQLSYMQPSTRADGTALQTGDIFIALDNFSDTPINILKENSIMIYPTNCFQWDGSAWVKTNTKIYQNGEWKALTNVLIANNQNYAGFDFIPYRQTTGGNSVNEWSCPTLSCSTDHGFTENYIEIIGKSYSGYSNLKLQGTLNYVIPYGQESYDPFTKIYINETEQYAIVKNATGSDETQHGSDALDISIDISEPTVSSIKIHNYASWGSGAMNLTITKLWLE